MREYAKYYILIFLLWSVVLINPSGFLFEDDEGAYLYTSASFADGSSLYSDIMTAKPPLIFIIGRLLFHIFSNNIVVFRYFASIMGLIASLFIFKLFINRNGPKVAVLMSAMFILDPLIFTQMRFFRTDIFMLTFIITGIYFLMKEDTKSIIYASLLFGLGVLTRDDAILYTTTISLYFLIKKRDTRILVIFLSILIFIILSVSIRGSTNIFGSIFQQIPAHNIVLENKFDHFVDFLRYLIKTYPVWLIFPAFILPIIKIKSENFSIFALIIIGLNLVAMFVSESHFVRYVMIAIIARLFLFSDFIKFFNEKFSLIVAGVALILQIVLNPPPLSELSLKDDSVLKISKYLKENIRRDEKLLSDYGFFNFHSKIKGASISGYISGGSVRTGEIDSKRLKGVIEKENVNYLLIHTDGRIYYPYGAEVYYYEPHHIKGLKDFEDFDNFINTNFTHIKHFTHQGQ